MSHTISVRQLLGFGSALLLLAGCSPTSVPPEQIVAAATATTSAPPQHAPPTSVSSSETASAVTSPTAVGAATTAAPTPASARFDGKIDVGGYKLQIRCVGAGSPTVVFDSGLGVPGLTWVNSPGKRSPWQAVSAMTRACIYDRAGLGDSDRGPPPRDSQQIVKELHTLLAIAGVGPPYVLVGHSFGGHTVRLYASQYPDHIAGMVLVDVLHEDHAERYRTALTMDEKERAQHIVAGMGANAEGINVEVSDAQVRAARAAVPFPPIPLVVLSAGRPSFPPGTTEDERTKVLELQQELHADLARLAPQGKLVTVEQSGHAIQQDQPDILIDAIREVVEAARQAGAAPHSTESLPIPPAPTADAAPNAVLTPSSAPPPVWPTPPAEDYEALVHIFNYDPHVPLDIEETSVRDISGVTVADMSYASPKGGRVPAYLVTPPGTGPFAGVLLMHGQPGQRVDLLPYALGLAKTGAVVLLIDAPWNRRAGEIVTFTPQDREEQIQLIVDLRRGVDLLAAQNNVDAERIGYSGGGYGAALGGLLAGVEQRLKAYALALGDGGLVEHYTDERGSSGLLQRVPKEQQEHWIAAMQPIEPLRFMRHAAPAAFFFQNAQRDQIPKDDETRFYEAASEPKRIEWYTTDEQLVQDQVAWLSEQIGLDANRFTMLEP